MRPHLRTGVAATAALTLFTAAPAAAETETKTIVTTHSVPADTAIAIPFDYDRWGDAIDFVPDKDVEFPLEVMGYDSDLAHQTFATSAIAPEGCVRVVESFTFGYTLADWYSDDEWASLAGGIGTGEPLNLISADTIGTTYSGDGTIDIDTDRVWVDLEIDAPGTQSGTLTLSYPDPVGPLEARGYVAFWAPGAASWILDDASFLVTDTCTSEVEVEVPVVTPPVEELPEPPVAVAPPVVMEPSAVATPTTVVATQSLAVTGLRVGPAAAAATLLLTAGVAALLLTRRRTNT